MLGLLHHNLIHLGREQVGKSRYHDLVTFFGVRLPAANRLVICFINDIRSQWAEQLKNVQDFTLAGLVDFSVIQPFQRLDAPLDDQALIAHATESILKTVKVLLDAENNAGNHHIGEGWLVQVQNDVSPKFLDLSTIWHLAACLPILLPRAYTTVCAQFTVCYKSDVDTYMYLM